MEEMSDVCSLLLGDLIAEIAQWENNINICLEKNILDYQRE
jgi:hypothetical protein